MVLAEKITVVNEPFTYYRVNTGSSQTDGLASYPESAYLPYIELKKSLVNWGIYETVKQSFVNCATAFMRYFYDKVNTFEAFEFLTEKLQNEVFQELDINGKSKDYFYDERLYQWQKQVSENSAKKLAFMAARSFGCDNTTAALRFQFPYYSIPRDSRIVILGAGIMGRHFYANIVLSAYCDVVLWCEYENHGQLSYIHEVSEIKSTKFDLVLLAYTQVNLIKKSIDYLNSIGVPNEKIIQGGM
jgi:hypothetical protein